MFGCWAYFSVFNRKNVPCTTKSFVGFGNHFQMRNDFKGEEQPKLRAILPPAPPGIGQRGGGAGRTVGGALETGCLPRPSCGQPCGHPRWSRRRLCLGAALPSQALPHILIPCQYPAQASGGSCHFAGKTEVRHVEPSPQPAAAPSPPRPPGSLQVRAHSVCGRRTERKSADPAGNRKGKRLK